MSWAFSISGANLVHPWHLATGELLDTSATSASGMDEYSPESSDSVSASEDIDSGAPESALSPPHPTLSPVQVSNSPPLLSTAWPTAPISLHESSDGLLEHPWGRLKDLFYSCPKLLSHPSFCFSNHQSCNPFGLLVPLCPLRRTLGQPSQDGLLLQFVSLLSLPPRQAPLTFWQQLPLQWKLWTWHIQILCPQPVKPGVSAAQKTYRYRALM